MSNSEIKYHCYTLKNKHFSSTFQYQILDREKDDYVLRTNIKDRIVEFYFSVNFSMMVCTKVTF